MSSFTDSLAEEARKYKRWQTPHDPRTFYLFKYDEVKQATGYAQRIHRGKGPKGAILTGIGLKLARYYFKWGVHMKDIINQIYEEYESQIPEV